MDKGEQQELPRIGRNGRKEFLAAHPELVPLGTLKKKGQTAPAAALVYNGNAHEYQPWANPADAVPMPADELAAAQAKRRAADENRLARCRCPRCGKLVSRSLETAKLSCLGAGKWDTQNGRVKLCPDCWTRERAKRTAARAAELAAASSKKPVPRAKAHPSVIVLDTETTGLDWSLDALLTIGICDPDGREVAYFEVCPPPEFFEWPDAAKVNGIHPADTLDWPTLEDVRPELQSILDAADRIVIYNAEFDLGFLHQAGFTTPSDVFDVMTEFAPVFGQWSDEKQDWKWQRLTTCAAYYGAPKFDAHNALGDAQATAWCYSKMVAAAAAE